MMKFLTVLSVGVAACLVGTGCASSESKERAPVVVERQASPMIIERERVIDTDTKRTQVDVNVRDVGTESPTWRDSNETNVDVNVRDR